MNKFVVVTFLTEEKAYEGVRALNALDAEGSLTLYGVEVVARNADGVLEVKHGEDTGPVGMGLGALLGGLIGMLGGPVGAMAGFTGGAMIGGTSDLVNIGVSSSFVDEVSQRLTPGRTAVIAEIDEGWITPLDARMESLGGEVLREWSVDVEDEYYAAQVAARKAELAELKAEVAHANEETRSKLRAKIDEASARLAAARDKAQERMELRQQATSAKIQALSERAVKVKSDAKTAMDSRLAALKDELAQRKVKLAQAHVLARESDKMAVEALAP